MRGQKCCLCKKETDEETNLYVGGCLTHTHESCKKIVQEYIDRLANYEGIIQKVNSSRLRTSFAKDKLNATESK